MITREKIVSGLVWKFLERCGYQLVSFIVQVILARLLAPNIYGTLSIMIVFITLANVINQTGFNTALIQRNDTTELDFTTAFYICLSISGFLYVILFLTAPAIERYYKISGLSMPLRVLALKLFPGAFNSIQIAKVTKELKFKKIFFSSLGGMLVSGVAGIVMAYKGYELWALVAQQLICDSSICVIMWFTVSWRPQKAFSKKRAKLLFSFGWKMTMSLFLDTLYQNLRNLVIGKKFNAGMLAFYDRGKQFPSLIINNIQQTISSVMLPAFSSQQDDIVILKAITRRTMSVSTFIIFPLMAGIAAVSQPLVRVLLTEKWLNCVPFIRISCLCFAFYPILIINLEAISSLGRSDIFLKLEIIKKIFGVSLLVVSVIFYNSAMAIAIGECFLVPIALILNALPSRKLLNYKYSEQAKDFLPSLLLSAMMYFLVSLAENISKNDIVTILFQVITGTIIYIGCSWLMKIDGFVYLLNLICERFKKVEEEI